MDKTLLHRVGTGPEAIEIHAQDDERWLTFDGGAIQSKVNLRHPLDLPLPYTTGMAAPLLFRRSFSTILMLGLGGGALLRFYRKLLPAARFTVVEVSPLMAKVAQRYFDAPIEHEGVDLLVADARQAVQELDAEFDLVMVDIFDHQGLPEWVLQPPFCEALRARMGSEGILIANLWVDALANKLDAVEPLLRACANRCLMFHPAASSNLVVMGFGACAHIPLREELLANARDLQAATHLDTFDLFRRIESMHPENKNVLANRPC